MAGHGSPFVRAFGAVMRRSRAFAPTRRQAAAVAALSALFVVQCWMPLRPSGVFRDLIDGQTFLRDGALPTADPLLPYADSERFVVLNAGGALIEAAAWNAGGVSGLLLLTAALSTAAIGLWCLWAVRRHDGFFAAIPTLGWTLVAGFGAYDAAGTSRFGLAMMPVMLLLLDETGIWNDRRSTFSLARSPIRSRLAFAAIPALFALWVNLDASWILGLVALWTVAIGRIIEIRADRRAGRAAGPTNVSGTLSAALVATLATLANPYGWNLWGLLTLPLANDPFVATIGPLEPLTAWSLTGILAAISLAAAGRCLAKNYLRFRVVETLLLAGGLAFSFAFPDARLWTMPLLGALVLPPVFREALERLDRYRVRRSLPGDRSELDRFSYAPTGVAVLSIAAAFALTPAGDRLFGRPAETLEAVAVDAPLAEVPKDVFDAGLVFAPPWWSEAIAFQTAIADEPSRPPRLFADSRQSSLPPSLREDVARVLSGDEGWSAILDRYETKTLLLDARRQAEFAEAVRSEPKWREVAASESLLVFRREERCR